MHCCFYLIFFGSYIFFKYFFFYFVFYVKWHCSIFYSFNKVGKQFRIYMYVYIFFIVLVSCMYIFNIYRYVCIYKIQYGFCKYVFFEKLFNIFDFQKTNITKFVVVLILLLYMCCFINISAKLQFFFQMIIRKMFYFLFKFNALALLFPFK